MISGHESVQVEAKSKCCPSWLVKNISVSQPHPPAALAPPATTTARTSQKRAGAREIVDDLSQERNVRARQIADLQRRADRAESLAAQGAIIRASERLAGAREDAELEERAVKAHRHAEELAEKVCSMHVASIRGSPI